MRKITTQRNLRGILTLIIIFLCFTTYSQVGIGNTNPDPDSLLEVGDGTDTQGILIPRVSLTATDNPSPLSTDVAGMIVYNTNPNGSGSTQVYVGFYYNDGTDWIRIAPGQSDDWTITGNNNTTAGTNFLGTTNTQALRFRTSNVEAFEISGGNATNRGKLRAMTNGTAALPVYTWSTDSDIGLYRIGANTLGFSTTGSERMRILSDGRVSINETNPLGSDLFTATAASGDYAVNGYSSGGGVGVYGENTGTGIAVWGNAASYGVWGGGGIIGVIGQTATGAGVQGEASGAGLGVFGYANNATGWGMFARNANASGVGLVASGAGNGLTYLPTSGATMNGAFGGVGFSSSATGVGIAGVGNNGTTTINLTGGSGVSGTGGSTGVYGISIDNSGVRQGAYFTMNKAGNPTPSASDDPYAIIAGYDGSNYFGGYFDGNQDNTNNGGGNNIGEDYAYVGITVGNTTYKILGTGTNSTMINDRDGNKRVLFSPEAPEILFEDYGTGQLVNGEANIELDPLLSSVIYVSEDHPLKVFIQLEGDCNGVYVTNKTATGFSVKELNNGNSSVPFSWHIVANRADTKLSDGRVYSKHVGVRFPIGPNKMEQLDTRSDNAVLSKDKFDKVSINKEKDKSSIKKD
jgi:hypothetical protein